MALLDMQSEHPPMPNGSTKATSHSDGAGVASGSAEQPRPAMLEAEVEEFQTGPMPVLAASRGEDLLSSISRCFLRT
eukprot:2289649-Prymnesium_polylepis.1